MMTSPTSLSADEIDLNESSREGWTFETQPNRLCKTFTFSNFHETMAFVNALAWIAHSMDHHPDFTVGYKTCEVTYTTHSAGGVTMLDLDAAERVNGLLSS